MRQVYNQGDFPNAAIPSAHIVGSRTQEWIAKEAEYRRQLALTRSIRESTPSPLLRARRKTGIFLIRAGMWLCAVRFPAKRPTVAA